MTTSGEEEERNTLWWWYMPYVYVCIYTQLHMYSSLALLGENNISVLSTIS
jgi:hypothetical protein